MSLPESPHEVTLANEATSESQPLRSSVSPNVTEREGDDETSETRAVAETYPLVRKLSNKNNRQKPWLSLSEEHGDANSDGG